MTRFLCVLLVSVMLSGWSSMVKAQAQAINEGWKIAVLPNTAVSIKPQYQPAFKRVKGILSSSLQSAGYAVFSESQLGLADCINRQCQPMTESELLEHTRSTLKTNAQNSTKSYDSEINLLLIYDLIISQKSDSWHIRIPAYTLDLDSGEQGDHWTGAQREFAKSSIRNCLGSCLTNWLAQSAASIARDAAHGVILQLDERERLINYQLTLQSFTPDETAEIEQLLKDNVPDLQSEFSFTKELNRHSHFLHQLISRQYHYLTPVASGFLTRRLQQLIASNQLAATVSYDGDQRRFVIARQGMAYFTEYVLAMLLLTLGTIAGVMNWQHKLRAIKHSKTQQIEKNSLIEARQLMLAGQRYQALDLLAGLQCGGERGDVVTALSEQVINQMGLLTGRIVGHGALANVEFYCSDNLAIGRSANSHDGVIGIGYKRLSRRGKQTLLNRCGDDFIVSDSGSSNGSWLDGQPLASAQRLRDGSILALGGQRSQVLGDQHTPDQAGCCRLAMQLPPQSPGTLIIKPQNELAAMLDHTALTVNWPTLAADRLKTWVLPGAELTIGLDSQGQLDFAGMRGSRPIAVLVFANGFAKGLKIKPLIPASLTIDGVKIDHEVPVCAGAEVRLNGVLMSFEQG